MLGLLMTKAKDQQIQAVEFEVWWAETMHWVIWTYLPSVENRSVNRWRFSLTPLALELLCVLNTQ